MPLEDIPARANAQVPLAQCRILYECVSVSAMDLGFHTYTLQARNVCNHFVRDIYTDFQSLRFILDSGEIN